MKLRALVDSGFFGYVCIPLETAKDLGLVLCGSETFELADGHWITQFRFKGKVRFLGKVEEVEILVSDSDRPQVGMRLLAECRLTIDFPSNKVQITRKKD